jgi:hypothetical protein
MPGGILADAPAGRRQRALEQIEHAVRRRQRGARGGLESIAAQTQDMAGHRRQ